MEEFFFDIKLPCMIIAWTFAVMTPTLMIAAFVSAVSK